MALYRNISINFWTDPKVDDEFTPEDKYFYLYLLTNPHTNICGCYEISSKQMVRETGYNEDTIMRLLNRMEKTHHVIRYDTETKEVLIVNWSKYNWTASEKLSKAVLNTADHIKSENFKNLITQLLNKKINNNDIIQYTVTDTDTDTATVVSIGYEYPIDTVSKKPNKSQYIAEFEEVWKLYPRKEGKTNAFKAYTKARLDGISKETIIDGLNRYKEQIRIEKTATQYIKHGSSWFNQRCWQDEYKSSLDDMNINSDRPKGYEILRIDEINEYNGKTYYYKNGVIRKFNRYDQMEEEINPK